MAANKMKDTGRRTLAATIKSPLRESCACTSIGGRLENKIAILEKFGKPVNFRSSQSRTSSQAYARRLPSAGSCLFDVQGLWFSIHRKRTQSPSCPRHTACPI